MLVIRDHGITVIIGLFKFYLILISINPYFYVGKRCAKDMMSIRDTRHYNNVDNLSDP